MAVSTFSWMSAQTLASDAEFRKWAQGIHDALAACGMVQTADTGQADLATMTVPAANTYYYEVWRFDDASQATAPIFVKVEYGTSSVTGRPGMRLSLASASSGAGSLTGNIYLQPYALGAGPVANSTEYPSYASGDGSSINVVLWPASTTSGGVGGFSISRSCDTAGAYNGDGLVIVSHGGGASVLFQVVGIGGSDPNIDCAKSRYIPVVLPYTVNNVNASAASTLSEDGTTAPTFPVPCAAPGVAPWALNSMVVVHPGDAGATSVIQVATINGAARTYRAFTGLGTSATPGSVVMLSSSTAVGNRCFPAIAWAV